MLRWSSIWPDSRPGGPDWRSLRPISASTTPASGVLCSALCRTGTGASARLADLVRIEHLEGRVGPATLEARGDMTWTGTEIYSDVTLNMRAEASDVLSWLTKDADIGFRPGVEGHIDLRAAVTGTVEHPRFAGRIELESAGLHIPELLTKPLHAPAAIEFDSRLSEGHRLVVPRLVLHFPPIKIIGDGTIDFSEDMEFAANVTSGAISVNQLPKKG